MTTTQFLTYLPPFRSVDPEDSEILVKIPQIFCLVKNKVGQVKSKINVVFVELSCRLCVKNQSPCLFHFRVLRSVAG